MSVRADLKQCISTIETTSNHGVFICSLLSCTYFPFVRTPLHAPGKRVTWSFASTPFVSHETALGLVTGL